MVKKKRLTVEVDGEFTEVEFESDKDTLIFHAPGRAIAKLRPIKQDEGVYLGLINNRPHLFRWESNGTFTILQTSEAIYHARVHRGTLTGEKAVQPGGEVVVRAPMSGIVVKVLKGDGEFVSRETGVVIIEAMKMQNEVYAPVDGVVDRVFVKEGDSVKPGMALFKVRQRKE